MGLRGIIRVCEFFDALSCVESAGAVLGAEYKSDIIIIVVNRFFNW